MPNLKFLCLKDGLYFPFFFFQYLDECQIRIQNVRQLATSMFANLIKLIPLDNENVDNDQDLPKNLLELKLKQKSFIDELMSLKNVQDIDMPVKIEAELRSYHIDGIKWLSFLNR